MFDVKELVGTLVKLPHTGYSLLTWNGLSFDFKVLAAQSGEHDVAVRLAMDHFDIMFQILCIKGFALGLDRVCAGAGLEGKKHVVALKDGSSMDHMEGKRAPELWAKGETEAVLAYLHDDVEQLWKLATVLTVKKSVS